GKVMQAAGSTLEALKEGFDVVRAGRDFLDPDCFSVHLVVEGRDAADADAKAVAARALLGASGSEVANSVPKVLRAEPFAELNSMLGPQGERWVPVHGIVPFSVAAQMYADCEAVFERHAEARSRYRIEHGYLCTTVATSGTLIEPVIYWPDARNCFHERVLAPDYLAKLPLHDENPAAREAVAQLRAELAAAFLRRGAVSFQIGKFYPYQQALDPSAAQLLESVKRVVDPQGRMNPGSLGLAQ
ncbi:MAG: hypothetical protein NZM12_01320, partial [Steroidobacteraceae bacterium]|nr:hypothetical protein [Steroidobacteraceae bacterium]